MTTGTGLLTGCIIRIVKVLACIDTQRLEATPSCALALKRVNARQHRERSREWPFAFSGRCGTTVQRYLGSTGFMGLTGFGVMESPDRRGSQPRERIPRQGGCSIDLALCSQALAPGSRRGKNSGDTGLAFCTLNHSTKKQLRGSTVSDYREGCNYAKAVKAGIVDAKPVGGKSKRPTPITLYAEWKLMWRREPEWVRIGAYRDEATARTVAASKARKHNFYRRFRIGLDGAEFDPRAVSQYQLP
jgi:hypothetical protein